MESSFLEISCFSAFDLLYHMDSVNIFICNSDRFPCLLFPFGVSILQAYVHLDYLCMSAILCMPSLPYFDCIS